MQNRNTTRRSARNDNVILRRAPQQKNFEVELIKKTENDLLYFVRQELEYYNALVDKLTPRLRAYPQEMLAIKDREKRLWDACAEHAVDPQKLISYPLDQWPAHLQHLHTHLYDQNNAVKITPAHLSIIGIAATPARLHASVRRSMANEVLKYMIGQAETLLAAMKTDTMRAPMQMLQVHTLDTKRHLQIPYNLVKITYNEEHNTSHIAVPYSTTTIVVPHFDLTNSTFKTLLVRAPHPMSTHQKWQIDLRNGVINGYMLNITDAPERRKRK